MEKEKKRKTKQLKLAPLGPKEIKRRRKWHRAMQKLEEEHMRMRIEAIRLDVLHHRHELDMIIELWNRTKEDPGNYIV